MRRITPEGIIRRRALMKERRGELLATAIATQVEIVWAGVLGCFGASLFKVKVQKKRRRKSGD
ncbi:hypothetical protein TYRP_014118 [Tyrophagus putrescentiae]|nr:hypothetical protein TYRP_014118 [Tyrophagus putrescentiae]